MPRLTSAEYAKTHGAAAGRQLHNERTMRFQQTEQGHRVVNTPASAPVHRLVQTIAAKHTQASPFVAGRLLGLMKSGGSFDGSYYGESGDEPGQKDGPEQLYPRDIWKKALENMGPDPDEHIPGESGTEPGQKSSKTKRSRKDWNIA
jgi:hypothetical protein